MKYIYNICICAIKILSLILVAFVLFICVTNRVLIKQNQSECAIFLKQSAAFYIFLPVSTVCIIFGKKLLEKISEKQLFLAAAVIYLAAGLFIIANIDSAIRADAQAVFEAARHINRGEYDTLQSGGYLFLHPNNLGITTYFRVLTAVMDSTKFVFFVNLLFVIAANWFIYKIAAMLSENSFARKYTIIFSFAFLPQLFFIVFVYGTIPGFCCTVAMVYFAVKYIRSTQRPYRKKTDIVLCTAVAALAIAATLLKSNYIIASVAMASILILHSMNSRRASCVLLSAFLLAASVFSTQAVTAYYSEISGEKIEGVPSVLYIAMGMQESKRGPGWYNGYHDSVFMDVGMDREKAADVGKAYIVQRLNDFSENPEYAREFYKGKIVSTWCEYTCESIWTGPRSDYNQKVDTAVLQNLYGEGKLYSLYYLFCSLIIVNLLIFTFIYQIISFRKKQFDVCCLFPLIFFIGGFLFHIMWETKSQYIYMYYLMLTPLAAGGVAETCEFIRQKIISKRKTP